jgi:hypothetical protein
MIASTPQSGSLFVVSGFILSNSASSTISPLSSTKKLQFAPILFAACVPPITANSALGQAKINLGSYAFPHIAYFQHHRNFPQ